MTYGYYRLYNEWNSRYSIVSGIDFKQTKNQLLFYPAEYMQTVRRFIAYSTFTRNFLLSNARIDLAIGAEYGKGGGTMIAEKKVAIRTEYARNQIMAEYGSVGAGVQLLNRAQMGIAFISNLYSYRFFYLVCPIDDGV